MSQTTPTTLHLKRSFGFGDRLGLATPGHLRAAEKYGFAPIFAQQSIREMNRTDRTPTEVMNAAQDALAAAGYDKEWGADADHLKTEEDVRITADAGFCFFTIDPSEYVDNTADGIPARDLPARIQALVSDGVFADADWESRYLGRNFEVTDGLTLSFTPETLYRAAVKYARSIAHCEAMAGQIRKYSADRPYEIEVSVDETDSPTSTLEHLFYGLELKHRGVEAVSLAPRFVGDFEKGIDYMGDLAVFEASLKEHVSVAKYCGPYKISVHSGSDKFSIYPIIGRVCGDLLHVKTAGTSYLEALRVVCRVDPQLFSEIAAYCHGRFAEDIKSYHISTTAEDLKPLWKAAESDYERLYLDENAGRQLLHVTFGSVLTKGKSENGAPFREKILSLLEHEAALHEEFLDRHFSKHLSLLEHGTWDG